MYYTKASALNNLAAGTQVTKMKKEAIDPCGACSDYMKYIRNSDYLKDIFDDADRFYFEGEYDKALVRYQLYSEFGSILAQQDAAWMLKRYFSDNPRSERMILQYMTQSSNKYALKEGISFMQIGKLKLDGASLVSIGDMYYSGTHGMPQDYSRALQCYLTVASSNPQALFKIGYMHQWGIGTEQDLDSAIMYFDRVAQSPYCIIAAKTAKFVAQCQKLIAYYSENLDMIALTIAGIVCFILCAIRFLYF